MTKSTKANTLVTLGELENGKPYTVDLANNPVVTIVGGSGSGKTRLTSIIVDELIENNTPEELHVIVMDARDSGVWRVMAKEPHVKGHLNDIQTFVSVLDNVKGENERRTKELERQGVSTLEDLEGNNNPQLVVVIDEMTQTMEALRNTDEESYLRFINTLENLATANRLTGIRLIVLGQRDIGESIPKGYLSNTTLKVGMKTSVKNDKLFGKGKNLDGLKLPTSPGEAVASSREYTEPLFIKAIFRDDEKAYGTRLG